MAIILAWIWLKPMNGYWIAGLFLPGVETSPTFVLPARLTPVPVLLSLVLSFVIVGTGTLYSNWRAATVSPRVAMR